MSGRSRGAWDFMDRRVRVSWMRELAAAGRSAAAIAENMGAPSVDAVRKLAAKAKIEIPAGPGAPEPIPQTGGGNLAAPGKPKASVPPPLQSPPPARPPVAEEGTGRVQIGPGQFVNEKAARALGLIGGRA